MRVQNRQGSFVITEDKRMLSSLEGEGQHWDTESVLNVVLAGA